MPELVLRLSVRKPKNPAAEAVRWPPTRSQLEKLVEEAIVDAYGEEEERTALLYTMIEQNLALPFDTEVLGVQVKVERIDLRRDEIVAICRSGGSKPQSIPILDLPLPKPAPPGTEWRLAYRQWARSL